MSECANAHPERKAVCEMRTPNHRTCTGWSVALGDYLDWDNPDYQERPKHVSKTAGRAKLKELAAAVPKGTPEPVSGIAAGIAGSERAAGTWDEEQIALVDKAIHAVCVAHAHGGEFTTDAIWDELGGAVPVTKGLTARLMVARRKNWLDSTDKTAISTRGGHHDHGQRLTVWYSLIDK